MQVALGLYIISKIGRAFTVVGWLYTGVLVLSLTWSPCVHLCHADSSLTLRLATPAVVLLSFTVPKIYELNKHEIDNAAHTGYKKVHAVRTLG